MDPAGRLTAEQALRHPFFERCEGSQPWSLTPRQRFRVGLSPGLGCCPVTCLLWRVLQYSALSPPRWPCGQCWLLGAWP